MSLPHPPWLGSEGQLLSHLGGAPLSRHQTLQGLQRGAEGVPHKDALSSSGPLTCLGASKASQHQVYKSELLSPPSAPPLPPPPLTCGNGPPSRHHGAGFLGSAHFPTFQTELTQIPSVSETGLCESPRPGCCPITAPLRLSWLSAPPDQGGAWRLGPNMLPGRGAGEQ